MQSPNLNSVYIRTVYVRVASSITFTGLSQKKEKKDRYNFVKDKKNTYFRVGAEQTSLK